MSTDAIKIAVLLPCYNEAVAIAGVIADFQQALPTATIYVFDNNSTDNTMAVARQAGAVVFSEKRQGKGYVVRRMFADINADVYVLADGDGTYQAQASRAMVQQLVTEHLDMIVGIRESHAGDASYRRGHQFGNRLFTRMVTLLFGDGFTDILSGYRVMSRRFVKSFPAVTRGFEIETQLTIHALELALPCAEVTTQYAARPAGSSSKLNTYRDGSRILLAILVLFKESKPLTFFSLLAALCLLCSLGLGTPVVLEYLATGLVPRFPSAILASAMGLMSVIFMIAGITLDTVSRNHREVKRLLYNAL